MSKLEVDAIEPQSGTTLTIGASGDSVTLGSGASLTSPGLTLSDNILFNAASKGIYLGVTTATASNLLDDYEEGTWTPTFFGSITPGTYTFSEQLGYYTKIGNLVHVSFELTNINTSSAGSGSVTIGGLPFTSASGRAPVAHSVWLSRWNISTDSDYQVQLEDNSTEFDIRRMTSGASGTGTSLDITDKASNLADVYTQFTYLTS